MMLTFSGSTWRIPFPSNHDSTDFFAGSVFALRIILCERSSLFTSTRSSQAKPGAWMPPLHSTLSERAKSFCESSSGTMLANMLNMTNATSMRSWVSSTLHRSHAPRRRILNSRTSSLPSIPHESSGISEDTLPFSSSCAAE